MRTIFLLLLVLATAGCSDNRRFSDGGPRDAWTPPIDASELDASAIDASAVDGGGSFCGDGERNGLEPCEGGDLGGASCESLGLGMGILVCDESCEFDGSGCSACTPNCGSRECGSDGCGGTCGAGCSPPETCSAAGTCECIRNCAGRACGSDGCGGTCGDCTPPDTCSASGQCTCIPSCGGRACGDDGCGGECGTCGLGQSCDATGRCADLRGTLLITEVFYDAVGGDNGLEWVEIYNASSRTIDLSGYSLGAGGLDYTYSTYQLTGTIPAGGCRVVGGPMSTSANAFPSLGQAEDFSVDIQNSGTPGDGVALFAVPAASITPATVPIDAVIYGSDNLSGLIDETGFTGGVDVGDVAEGGSIERTATGWRTQATPHPNDCRRL